MQSFFNHNQLGKFSAYQIQLKSLAPGTHEFEYVLDKQFFANMESADIHDADLKVKLTAVYRGDVYDLTFKITGNVVLLCDRCLDTMDFPIDASYHIMVKYGDDYNDDSDELLEIPQSDAYINVAYMLYDTVALAIPIKHVHPMGKCNRQMSALLKKHRARATGEDADLENELIDEIDDIEESGSTATDPRWDALRNLGTAETTED